MAGVLAWVSPGGQRGVQEEQRADGGDYHRRSRVPAEDGIHLRQ
jgi:hypothetical protein